jgi:hypothetical protein
MSMGQVPTPARLPSCGDSPTALGRAMGPSVLAPPSERHPSLEREKGTALRAVLPS